MNTQSNAKNNVSSNLSAQGAGSRLFSGLGRHWLVGLMSILLFALLTLVQPMPVEAADVALCSFDNEGITTGDSEGRIQQTYRVQWNDTSTGDIVKWVEVNNQKMPLIGVVDGNGGINNELIDFSMLPQSDGYGDFVMADFTGNGYVDIYVTRDATDNTPTDDVLLVNQGDNTFFAEDVLVDHVGKNTFVGDYNNDGNMDVYVSAKETCNGVPQSDCTDIILINDGTGNFTKTTLDNTRGHGASHVSYGDINNDGNIDILATLQYPAGGPSANKVVHMANGLGGYTQRNVSGGAQAKRAVLIDMNDDGVLDVFVGNPSGTDYYQLYNPSTDSFSSPINFQSSGNSWPSEPADYSGNGRTDLLVTELGADYIATLYINQGNGNFYPARLGQFSIPSAALSDAPLGVIFEMDAGGTYNEVYLGGGLRNTENDGLYYYATCDNPPADPVCGNGIVEEGEECEINTPGCGETCERVVPECTLTVNGGSSTTVPTGVSVTFESSVTGGVVKTDFDFGNGDTTSWSETINYAYTGLGTYAPRFAVENPSYPALNTTCSVTVTVSNSSCGNGVVEPGEQCGEYDASGNPLVSCSGNSICNQSTCSCHDVCPLVPGDPVEFIVQPFNFGDGYDVELTQAMYNGSGANVDHTYNFANGTGETYTSRLRVINPGNNSVVAYCEEDIEVTENLCGNDIQNPGEECGEPGLSCGDLEICNPVSCQCMNQCDYVEEDTTIEECDDGMHCSDGTSCTEDSECTTGDGLCLPRSGDGCTAVCEDEYCGDGIIQEGIGEECDMGSKCIEGSILPNGNNRSGFVCTDDPTICGDPGNCQPLETDTCTVTCKEPFCGDGNVQQPNADGFDEQCDPGSFCADGTECTTNPNICNGGPDECIPRDTVECSASCTPEARCGDGEVQPELGEECDEGGDNSDTGSCNDSCELTFCGDGITQSPNGNGLGEQCDEGDQNGVFGSGCDEFCQLPPVDKGECIEESYIDRTHETFPEEVANQGVWGALCKSGNPVEILPGDIGGFDLANFTEITLENATPVTLVKLYDLGVNWMWRCEGTEETDICQTTSCGDGILQYNGGAREECDDGNNVSGDGCSETCEIEAPLQPVDFDNDPATDDVSCIDRTGQKDGVLPVAHPDEYLPVYREAETNDTFVDRDATSCEEFDANPYGGLLGTEMTCDFVLSNSDQEFTQQGEDYTFQVPCYNNVNTKESGALVIGDQIIEDALENHEGYSDGTLTKADVEHLLGVYRLDLRDYLDSQAINYGQFKINLTNIRYQYCAKEAINLDLVNPPVETNRIMDAVTLNPDEPVCEAKASITKGYLTQKGFTLQEVPNSDLADFLSYENVQLAPEGTPVDPNNETLTTIPQGDQGKERLFAGFVEQYDQSGIIEQGAGEAISCANCPTVTADGWDNITAKLYKVPNDSIFFYEPNISSDITVDVNNAVIGNLLSNYGLSPNQPFTLVVQDPDGDPTVEPNITLNIDNDLGNDGVGSNGAYIVNGNISFNPDECDDSNLVEGIFIANGIFTAEPIRNHLAVDPELTERCAGGSLKIDGVLVGDGIDENFANARRSILSSRTEPGSSDPGLFDNSLPGQARELFNVCLAPNLLNYVKGAPGAANKNEPKYARPVTAKGIENADGDLEIEYLQNIPGLSENICTIATFDRGRQWIENNLTSCDQATGEICDTPHQRLIDKVLSGDRDATTLRTFKDYAENTINYHIVDKLNNDKDSILGGLRIDSKQLPSYVDDDNGFICDPIDKDGCFEITYYTGANTIYTPSTRTVYRPARNVARNILFNEPLTDGATLADIRSAYAGFEDVQTEFELGMAGQPEPLLPQTGLLALLKDLDSDWYQDYVEFGQGLYLLFNNTFLNIYEQFLDYQRLIDQQSQLAGQNQQRSASIFEGSAVLLQLNAAKRTQLSPGLKAYLDRTIVEK